MPEEAKSMNEQLLAEIAEEWGTPVYVYDKSVMRKQYSSVATAICTHVKPTAICTS